MKLWGSRMGKPTDDLAHRLNASFQFDRRMYNEDIDASLAWARALAGTGLLEVGELDSLTGGLEEIRTEFDVGDFEPSASDEDIHTAVERRLTEIVGPVAGKLHTGRSRNDQVSTDFRLWIMRACDILDSTLVELQKSLLCLAEADLETALPGYTHLQPAQPVLWAHWVLSHFWPLDRDRTRLRSVCENASVLPLGSGALAGTTLQVDRRALADDLSFKEISPNSMDAVSDRDFAAEFLFTVSLVGVHLSRLAEQLILYSTPEFDYVEIDDAYATGSSLMPQKKNPDVLELARGKTGRLIGNLAGLLATLKGLPSAYDKDLQEDKEPVFDSYDALVAIIPAFTGLIGSLHLHPKQMMAGIDAALFATDLADYLVDKGIPFREAHSLVGEVVRQAEEQGVALSDLPLSTLQSIDERFGEDVAQVFDLRAALDRRSTPGGTSPRAVTAQLEQARASLM